MIVKDVIFYQFFKRKIYLRPWSQSIHEVDLYLWFWQRWRVVSRLLYILGYVVIKSFSLHDVLQWLCRFVQLKAYLCKNWQVCNLNYWIYVFLVHSIIVIVHFVVLDVLDCASGHLRPHMHYYYIAKISDNYLINKQI